MSFPRDSYRRRVYKAEAVLGPQATHDFKSFAQVKEYIGAVLASRWVLKRFPPRLRCMGRGHEPQIIDGRGTRTAYANRYRINLPKWARSKRVILHELAHFLILQESVRHPAHGRLFCRTYLMLVKRFMGVEAEKKLRAEYVRLRVPYRSKKRLSPETIAKLRERGKALAATKRQRITTTERLVNAIFGRKG